MKIGNYNPSYLETAMSAEGTCDVLNYDKSEKGKMKTNHYDIAVLLYQKKCFRKIFSEINKLLEVSFRASLRVIYCFLSKLFLINLPLEYI